MLSDLKELGAEIKFNLEGRPARAFSFNGCLLYWMKLVRGEIID